MELKIDVRPKGNDITMVVLRGEIGTETVSQFKDKVEAVVKEGHRRLIMDFQEVSYLNSMGLRSSSHTEKIKKRQGRSQAHQPFSGRTGSIRPHPPDQGF